MATYLRTLKSLADSLAAINSPVSHKDLVIYAFVGLPSEYESFITTDNKTGTLLLSTQSDGDLYPSSSTFVHLILMVWSSLVSPGISGINVLVIPAPLEKSHRLPFDRVDHRSSDPVELSSFISTLSSRFAMKNLGDLHFFLGIEARHDSSGLFLSQNHYVATLLHRFDMLGANSVSTPIS
ncbi:hypothetical protein RJ640_026017 [Escallonia rubra]|uniref:Reverse transcriptase Ty1/copia-type domain-containing protein n=1 Tax=Escallonia rubra TaxID=112253 RepID=A0AA88UKW1_9ASTE|nr:hypothetical protein RJ640_026017 [Escallonia rubra]